MKLPRPPKLKGTTYKKITGCGSLFITVNMGLDNTPKEVFATLGKAGGCASSQCEAIGRLTSLLLRTGRPIQDIQRELIGTRCFRPIYEGCLSCADAIGKVLEEVMKESKK